ncbi:hypothetical protein GCM10023083_85090 [Streptomyces phyllanthi]
MDPDLAHLGTGTTPWGGIRTASHPTAELPREDLANQGRGELRDQPQQTRRHTHPRGARNRATNHNKPAHKTPATQRSA